MAYDYLKVIDSRGLGTFWANVKSLVQSHRNYSTTTITIPSASWSNSTYSATVQGVTSTNTVFVSPAPSSLQVCATCGVYCSSQGTDSLTFSCTITPPESITMNILMLVV